MSGQMGARVGVEESRASRSGEGKYRRPGLGVAAALGVFLLVAVPAGESAYLSLLSFTGACFLGQCSEPAVGAVMAVVAILLLALPLAAGVFVARVPLRRGWPWLVGSTGVLLIWLTYAQRVM